MIESILRLAIARRYLFLSLTLVILGIGIWSYQHLPIDAVPDITNVQVQNQYGGPWLFAAGGRATHYLPRRDSALWVAESGLYPIVVTLRPVASNRGL